MITINLFKTPHTSADDRTTIDFSSPQIEAIFYYLVYSRRPIRHTELTSLFWQLDPQPAILAELQATLAALQQQVGDYLIITPESSAFNRGLEHWVDLYELESLLGDHTIPEQQKLEELRRLYRGELLPGLERTHGIEFRAWLYQQRQQFNAKIGAALDELIESFLRQADYSHWLKASGWWLMLEPTNELASRLRAQLFLHIQHQQEPALQSALMRDYLQMEQELQASEETRKLWQQVHHDIALIHNPPHSPPQQPNAQPPGSNHNLPKFFTSFIGREGEVEQLTNYLLVERCPLMAIVGEGGVGKTRLASVVAERICDPSGTLNFPDGIWFVACTSIDAGFTAPEQLLRIIGTNIGLSFRGATPLFKQLVDSLASKSMLLIIDNFEHLADHLPLLLSLHEQAPAIQILLISRHNIATPHVKTLRLEGLEISAFSEKSIKYQLREDELTQLHAIPSVHVLEMRAQRVWPKFAINHSNGVAATKLCKLLEGSPLALELAATLVLTHDVEKIYTELCENYTLLESDLQDLPPRQRSIHNTIDYTWRMLPPELASLMAQCSIFRGNFSHEALTAITNAPDTHISQLEDRYLLHKVQQNHFHIHEMVRQFAAMQLAQKPILARQSALRHSEYYIELLRSWWHGTESRHQVTLLMPHIDNIYAAWKTAFEHQRYDLLSHAIIPFTQFHVYAGLVWDAQESIANYRQRLDRVIGATAPDSIPDPYREIWTALTFAHAIFHYTLGDNLQSFNLFSAVERQVADGICQYLAADLEYSLGSLARRKQHFATAQHHYARSEAHTQRMQQPYIEIRLLLSMMTLKTQLGQAEEGEACLKRAFILLQQYPDVQLETSYYSAHGDLCHAQGRWSEALANFRKAIEVETQPPNHNLDFHTLDLHTIGKLLWQSGRFEQAKQYLEQIQGYQSKNFYRTGKFWHTVWLIDFANLYNAWQQPVQALFYCQWANIHAHNLDNRILQGRVLKAQGSARLQQQQWHSSLENLSKARTIFQQEAALDFECTALTELIHLFIQLHDQANIIQHSESLWTLLHSNKLDGTNAEPIKAWWACHCGFQATADERAAIALHTAYQLFQTQLANIDDETWQSDFSNQIVEHRALRATVHERKPAWLTQLNSD